MRYWDYTTGARVAGEELIFVAGITEGGDDDDACVGDVETLAASPRRPRHDPHHLAGSARTAQALGGSGLKGPGDPGRTARGVLGAHAARCRFSTRIVHSDVHGKPALVSQSARRPLTSRRRPVIRLRGRLVTAEGHISEPLQKEAAIGPPPPPGVGSEAALVFMVTPPRACVASRSGAGRVKIAYGQTPIASPNEPLHRVRKTSVTA
ncbi:unnamed protein product [Lampetra fluviatilis]